MRAAKNLSGKLQPTADHRDAEPVIYGRARRLIETNPAHDASLVYAYLNGAKDFVEDRRFSAARDELCLIIACRRQRRAVREPRRIDIHVHVHVDGLPGGPGERDPVFFEEPEDPPRERRRVPSDGYAADTPRRIPRNH
jgi:hypothetical protein